MIMRYRGPDHMFVNTRLSRRLMNGRLADWLQQPGRRRLVCVGYVATGATLSVVAGIAWHHAAGYVFPDLGPGGAVDAIVLWGGVAAGLLILAGLLEQLIFVALKPVFVPPEAPFDERQEALVTRANARGRHVALFSILVMMVFGIHQAGTGIALGLGCFLFALSYMMPHLILAWTLPADDFDTEGAQEDDLLNGGESAA
jgi:hypothetical protein